MQFNNLKLRVLVTTAGEETNPETRPFALIDPQVQLLNTNSDSAIFFCPVSQCWTQCQREARQIYFHKWSVTAFATISKSRNATFSEIALGSSQKQWQQRQERKKEGTRQTSNSPILHLQKREKKNRKLYIYCLCTSYYKNNFPSKQVGLRKPEETFIFANLWPCSGF